MATPGSSGAYFKLERRVGDFAIAAVAAQVSLKDGRCERAGLALTAVGPTNIKARRAEEALMGQRPDEAAIRRAAALAAEECQPVSDLRGSADYKRDMVRVLTMRALRRALERAQG